jgi:hypothetical protein
MKNVLVIVKNKISLVGIILISVAVGGATTAGVMAAIPDSSGNINGCYDNSTGALRVINSENSDTCSSGETALNWSQAQPSKAYGYVSCNGTSTCALDSNHSGGLANYVQVDAGDNGNWGCITVGFTPNVVTENSGSYAGALTYTFKDGSGSWVHPEEGGYTDQCNGVSGTNMALALPVGDTRGIYFVVQ